MTASTDTKPASTKSSSRRALLAGALGGIGAVAAGAMAKVSPVRAANGDTVTVGGTFTGTSTTYLRNQNNDSDVFQAESTQSGIGITGTSSSSIGVVGESNSGHGVVGTNNSAQLAAVLGYAFGNGTGVSGSSGAAPPLKPKTGVYGFANQDSSSKGVWGYSGRGVGVYAQANKAGYALQTNGRIKASKVSGVKTISAGLTSVTLNPGVKVTNASFVLLSPRVNLGGRDIWYTTNPTAGTITIHMSSSRSKGTKIGWLLLG